MPVAPTRGHQLHQMRFEPERVIAEGGRYDRLLRRYEADTALEVEMRLELALANWPKSEQKENATEKEKNKEKEKVREWAQGAQAASAGLRSVMCMGTGMGAAYDQPVWVAAGAHFQVDKLGQLAAVADCDRSARLLQPRAQRRMRRLRVLVVSTPVPALGSARRSQQAGASASASAMALVLAVARYRRCRRLCGQRGASTSASASDDRFRNRRTSSGGRRRVRVCVWRPASACSLPTTLPSRRRSDAVLVASVGITTTAARARGTAPHKCRSPRRVLMQTPAPRAPSWSTTTRT